MNTAKLLLILEFYLKEFVLDQVCPILYFSGEKKKFLTTPVEPPHPNKIKQKVPRRTIYPYFTIRLSAFCDPHIKRSSFADIVKSQSKHTTKALNVMQKHWVKLNRCTDITSRIATEDLELWAVLLGTNYSLWPGSPPPTYQLHAEDSKVAHAFNYSVQSWPHAELNSLNCEDSSNKNPYHVVMLQSGWCPLVFLSSQHILRHLRRQQWKCVLSFAFGSLLLFIFLCYTNVPAKTSL